MKAWLALAAILTLVGCAAPQREAFAPKVGPKSPMAEPAHPADVQDCRAGHRHRKLEYADFTGADSTVLRFVADAHTDASFAATGTEPSNSVQSDSEAGCSLRGKGRTVYG